VVILDINDNTPMFSQPSYIVDVSEGVAPGTEILSLNAVDLDEDQQLFYTILSVTSPASNNKFKINSVSGTLVCQLILLFLPLVTGNTLSWLIEFVTSDKVQKVRRLGSRSPFLSTNEIILKVTDRSGTKMKRLTFETGADYSSLHIPVMDKYKLLDHQIIMLRFLLCNFCGGIAFVTTAAAATAAGTGSSSGSNCFCLLGLCFQRSLHLESPSSGSPKMCKRRNFADC